MFIPFLSFTLVVAYRRTIDIPDIHGDSEALLQSLYAGYADDVVQISPVSNADLEIFSNPSPPTTSNIPTVFWATGKFDIGEHSLDWEIGFWKNSH